jgi:hypothetical protein
MKQCEFISALSAVATLPLAARAEQPEPICRIGAVALTNRKGTQRSEKRRLSL